MAVFWNGDDGGDRLAPPELVGVVLEWAVKYYRAFVLWDVTEQ